MTVKVTRSDVIFSLYSTLLFLRRCGYALLVQMMFFTPTAAKAALPDWYTQEDMNIDAIPYAINGQGQILAFTGGELEYPNLLRTFLFDPKRGWDEAAPPQGDEFISQYRYCKPANLQVSGIDNSLYFGSYDSPREALADDGTAIIECIGHLRNDALVRCGYVDMGNALALVRFTFTWGEGLERRGGPISYVTQSCAEQFKMNATSPAEFRAVSSNGIVTGKMRGAYPRIGVIDDLIQEFPANEEISRDAHTEMMSINSVGDFVGFSRAQFANSSYGNGFVRRNGVTSDLVIAGLDSTRLRPTGISDLGVIYGRGFLTGTNDSTAFIERDGITLLVRELVPHSRYERVENSFISDVNNNGVAAALGYSSSSPQYAIPFLLESDSGAVRSLRDVTRAWLPEHVNPARMGLGEQELSAGRVIFPSALITDDNVVYIRGKRRGSEQYTLVRLTPHFASQRRGDVNCDGTVNNFDIDPFILLLTQPSLYLTQYPSCSELTGDFTGDGVVNNFDIQGFLELFEG